MQTTTDTPPQHQRTLDIAHVKLTYPQLLEAISRCQHLVASANQGITKLSVNESVSVSDATDNLQTNVVSIDAFSHPPEVAYSVRYDYSAQREAPISHVALVLNDSANVVQVSGTSTEQVETISRSVQASFSEYTVSGGLNFRLVAGLVILMLGVACGFYFGEKRGVKYMGIFTGSGFLIYLFFIFAGSTIFPGTAIYAGDPSWLSRNAPTIGGLGLLVTIASLIVPDLFRQMRLKRDASRDSPAST